MHINDIIIKKRDGKHLSTAEIDWFVKEYTHGALPDYQAAALLMAICINGMDEEETVSLTLSIRDSGDKVDLSAIDGIKIDKHSTGGVGDKTTLVVAPLVASLGVKVAKMSGRGLGHTGGTVDKLESIPGFCTSLTEKRFFDTVNSVGVAVIGQSANLAPADKKLYALRDVTGTVENHSLIVSSIMGKKLASGADGIVLDVKSGSGSFNKDLTAAKSLAKAMVSIGKAAGKSTAALITDMDEPLGLSVGNALEVKEAIQLLKGVGNGALRALCIELAALMLHLAGKGDIDVCKAMALAALDDGRALNTFKAMVAAQGGDTAFIDNPDRFPTAKHVCALKASRDGYITHVNAREYGRASLLLGAGRERKEDKIDHAAGILIEKKKGDSVKKGDVIAYLHSNKYAAIDEASAVINAATSISDVPSEAVPLIQGTIV